MCPLNVGVACIDKFERRGSRDEAECCDAVELLPFPNSPKQLRNLSSKDVNSFFNMHLHGRVLLAIRPSGPGNPGKKCQ